MSALREALLAGEAEFRSRHAHPWLVYAPAEFAIVEHYSAGSGGARRLHLAQRARPMRELEAQPLSRQSPNPFGPGVSFGRGDRSDVVLEDSRLSRYHGYFEETARGWAVTDAGSANGTDVDGLRVEPGQLRLLPPEATLSFGDLEARYFSLERFISFLRTA